MCKKFIFLISIVLVLSLVNSAVAEVLMHFGFDGTAGQPITGPVTDLTGNVTFEVVLEDSGTLTYGESNPDVKTSGTSANFAEKAGLEREAAGDDILDLTGTEYTIELWIKVNSFPDYDGHVFIKKYTSDYYFEVRGDGDLHFAQAGDATYDPIVSDDDVIELDTWYHVAAVFDALDGAEPQKIYVDRVKIAAGGTTALNPGTDDGLAIGHMWRPNDSRDDWYDGLIDEFRIHDVALGPDELGIIEEAGPYASSPSPANGVDSVRLNVVLRWVAGVYAQDVNAHDVYFGTDFTDVNDATTSSSEFKGHQDLSDFTYDPCDPCNLDDPCLLVYGKTYYWRIDEINDTNVESPWKGYTWHFTTDDGTAKNPDPPDGKWGVPYYKMLSWYPGIDACDVNGHDLYFGTDFNDVNDATPAVDPNNVYIGRQSEPNYKPLGGLVPAAFYYWRIDEFNDVNDGPDLYWKGHVWAFRAGGLLVGEWLFDDWYEPGEAIPDGNYTKVSSDTSEFGNHAWHTTSGAEASYTQDSREVLHLQNVANPFAITPPYAHHVVLPPGFGKMNPFDGSGDFTLMMDFKVKVKDDPNGGILLSSARDNSSSNHPMTIFMPEDGKINYQNWQAQGNVHLGTVSRYDDPNWHSLMVQYQASDGRLTVTMNNGTLNEEVQTEGDHRPEIPNIEEDTVMIGWSLCSKFPAGEGQTDWEEEEWEGTQAWDFTGYIDNLRIYDYFMHFRAWDPFPADDAGDVLPNVILNWKAGDYSTLHDVYFTTDSWDAADANTTVDPNGAYMGWLALDANSYDPNGPGLGVGQLAFGKEYFWRVDQINDANLWKGFVWSFTTTDGKAKNPDPCDTNDAMHPEGVITWTPGGYWVEDYKIYFSEDWNDVNDRLLAGYKGTQGVDSNSYDPCNAVGLPGLEFGKTYYWRIDETNDSNTWEGNIWYFTVDNGKAKDPDPCDTNDAVLPDPNLSWKPGIVATAHDIYFGTDWNDVNDGIGGTFKQTVVMDANSWDAGALWVGRTYYWRADSKNLSGQGYASEVKGDVWTFKVEYPKAYNARPYNPSWRIELDRVLTWTPGKYATRSDIYFGTDFDDVNDSSTTVYRGWLPWDPCDPCQANIDANTTYDPNDAYPAGLALDTVYYWRIDSIAAEERLTTTGDIFQFKTYRTGFEVVLLVDVTDWNKTLADANFMDPNYHKEGWGILTKWTGQAKYKDVNEPNCPQYDAEDFESSGDQDGPLTWTCNSNCYDPCGTMCYGISLDTGQTGALEGRTRVDKPNDAEPLCRDFFFNDDDDPDDDEGDIIFTLHDLDDGYYELTTFHNDAGEDEPNTIASAIVSGAVADPVHDYNAPQTNVNLDEACGFSLVTFNATGTGDVIVRYHIDDYAVRFNGFMLEYLPPDPNLAHDPIPSGAEEEQPGVVLKWTPGQLAAGANAHDVYFGSDFDDVNDANDSDTTGVYIGTQALDSNSYDPPGYLTFGQRYYWRIDENDNGNTWKGFVWSFKMVNYLTVDDFEVYDENSLTDDPCLVYIPTTQEDGIWRDYYSWGMTWPRPLAFLDTNSTVERGTQSMAFMFRNNWPGVSTGYSEAWRPYEADLLNTGVKAISLWFHGSLANDEDTIYVALEDDAGHIGAVFYPNEPNDPNIKDPNYYRGGRDLKSPAWHEWHIKLEDFTAPYQHSANDVNLASVTKFYLGFGDRYNPVQTGTGIYSVVYFDDIRVYPDRCVALYGPPADWNGDCVVDYRELNRLSNDWLLYDETIPATEPCDANLIAHWPFDDAAGPNGVEEVNIVDISGNGYNGQIVNGDVVWDEEGKYGWCLSFNKDFGVEIPEATFDNISEAITILVWVNGNEDQGDHSDQMLQAGDGAKGNSPYRISTQTDWLDDGVEWEVEDDSVSYEPNLNEWAGSWNHYAFTKDASTGVQRIYLNGKVVAERTDATNDPIGDIDKARIGMAPDRDGDEAEYKMDDIQLYNYALSAGEVAYVGGGGLDLYVPIASKAELYKEEPVNERHVNFKDYALFIEQWLDAKWFPEGP